MQIYIHMCTRGEAYLLWKAQFFSFLFTCTCDIKSALIFVSVDILITWKKYDFLFSVNNAFT